MHDGMNRRRLIIFPPVHKVKTGLYNIQSTSESENYKNCTNQKEHLKIMGYYCTHLNILFQKMGEISEVFHVHIVQYVGESMPVTRDC
jgi:hypothetical protein